MASESLTRHDLPGQDAVGTGYPRDTPIHALFEREATREPAAIALTVDGRDVTYGELNARANRVAHHLRRHGVGRGSPVGLALERSADLYAGLLGILKAGGAYVPLDTQDPAGRSAFVLKDTGVRVVLAHGSLADRFAPLVPDLTVVRLDADARAIRSEPETNPVAGVTAGDLAYVMYTSGSTGAPKGILIGHRAVVRLVRCTNYCRFGPGEVFLPLAPVSFDASTFEIWGALLNSGRLAVLPPQTPALHQVGEAIRQYGVTTLWLTAGLFHLMVEQNPTALSPLRQLLAGGDVLSPSHVREALDALRDGVVINGYGPTESTTFAVCHRMGKGDRVGSVVPIGRPVSHTTAYVLGEGGQPVAPGEPGELFLGGDGLARGYLNDPDLTLCRFVPDPFDGNPGARLYRTGDRVLCRPDGVFEFLGRVDDQVKVLGHRVEPGEVEVALGECPGVLRAVVTPRADSRGERRLVAYFVGTGDAPAHSVLRQELADRLPTYMVPSAFVRLEAFPLSPNGKVDRLALPAPEWEGPRGEPPIEPAQGLDQEIAAVWERVLGRRAEPDDNFFDLGGDSLLLIEAHAELQKRLARELPIMDLFEHTTVRALARHLGGSAGVGRVVSQAEQRAQQQREALARQRTRGATIGHE